MINQHFLKKLFPKRTKDFWLFEFSTWLHIFAVSLTSIFIPIMLYEASFSVSNIILYLLVLHLFDTPLNLLAEKIVYKKGAKIVIFIATLSNIIFLFLLSLVLENPTILNLILISFFAALYDSFYYVSSLYTFIGTNQKEENSSSNTSILYAVLTFAGLFSPFFGSFLLIEKGDDFLLYTSILIFFLSLIPLYYISKIITKPEHKPITIKKFFKQDIEIKNFINLSLFKFSSASEFFIWPLYVFATTKSLETISSLTIITSISGLIFIFINSKLKGQKIRNKIINHSAIIFIIIWISRISFSFFPNFSNFTEIFIIISTFISSSLIYFMILPIDTNIFSRAPKAGPLASSTFKNLFSMLSKLLFFLILYTLSLLIKNDIIIFKISFFISIISLFGILYYNKKNITN